MPGGVVAVLGEDRAPRCRRWRRDGPSTSRCGGARRQLGAGSCSGSGRHRTDTVQPVDERAALRRAASPSSPAPGAASAAPTPGCSPPAGASVVVNDLGGSIAGDGRRRRPGAGRGRRDRGRRRHGRRRHQRRVDARGRGRRSSTARSSGSAASTSWSTTPASCGGPACPTPTPTTSSATSPCTSPARSAPIRAAWPHMVAQGYGRIVMTTSTGVFGLPANLAYATAKGGVIGHDPQPRDRRAPSTASSSTSSPRRP